MFFITFLCLASGRWLLAAGLWHLASGFLWPLVPGLWPLGSGFWPLVSGLGKCPKIYENGHEWVRHESPRADIRRGRSYKLSDASGRPPDVI